MTSALIAAVLVAVADPTDLEKLQGTWEMAGLIHAGERQDPADFALCSDATKRNRFSHLGADRQEIQAATIRLDQSMKSRQIDLAYVSGPTEGTTKAGIYNLVEDRLGACFGRFAAPCPRDFKSTFEPSSMLFFDRKRPAR
jgi:uncharacterized protein (TIGR03067 family)